MEDKRTVDDYIGELRKLNEKDELQSTRNPVQAARTLLRLLKNGVKTLRGAVTVMNNWARRHARLGRPDKHVDLWALRLLE